jgi:hypothetical protein
MLDIVINTGPLIAMVAATGNLNWLPSLYGRIVIPLTWEDGGGEMGNARCVFFATK